MAEPFVLIHISDLHFHALPRRPGHWMSKRLLGALNLVLNRRRLYPPARAEALVAQLDGMAWDHLVITGDLTQLSTPVEFRRARSTLAPLLARGPEQVTVIPGNHDRYVADEAGRTGFQNSFGEYFGRGEIGIKPLTGPWWLCAWDSAVPGSLFSAQGHVREETLLATKNWIDTLPAGARVILANHYPLYFPEGFSRKLQHDLDNLETVRERIRDWPVALYLHGHDHHNWIMTHPNGQDTMTLVNSASSTQTLKPGQKSSFHRITLTGRDMEITPVALDGDFGGG